MTIVFNQMEANDKLFLTKLRPLVNCIQPNGAQWLIVSNLMEASD